MSTRHVVWGRPLANLRTLPDFVIVGAQRSGSTSLYRMLADHPQVVWPALSKSPHWFDVNYTQSSAWYRAHFPLRARMSSSDVNLVTGEAAPYYLFHPAVPRRLAANLPRLKIVAILRDPVERAWSHYQHERARGNEDLPFDEALRLEEARIAPEMEHLKDPAFVGYHHRHHSYASRGHYARQLARYFDEFERNQVHVMFTQHLKLDPQGSYDGLCDFLAIDRVDLGVPSRHHARSYDPIPPATQRHLRIEFEHSDSQLAELLGTPPPWPRSPT